MSELNGCFVFGLMRGIKITPYIDSNTGQEKSSYKIGVGVEVDDGYGGKSSQTIEVKLRQELYQKIMQQISPLIGKKCLVQFEINDRYKTLNFPEHGTIQQLKDKGDLKAA